MGIIGKKMETTIVYRDYRDYMGIMEKKMETTMAFKVCVRDLTSGSSRGPGFSKIAKLPYHVIHCVDDLSLDPFRLPQKQKPVFW